VNKQIRFRITKDEPLVAKSAKKYGLELRATMELSSYLSGEFFIIEVYKDGEKIGHIYPKGMNYGYTQKIYTEGLDERISKRVLDRLSHNYNIEKDLKEHSLRE
jgi:hypothetical protein